MLFLKFLCIDKEYEKEVRKMKNSTLKLGMVILIVIMLVSISISSFALEPSMIIGNISAQGTTEITNVGNSIVGILQVVGIVLSVIILIVLGIKYMMGSAEEKAEYKKTMMPYVVGAALIFAASALAQVIYQFFTGISA